MWVIRIVATADGPLGSRLAGIAYAVGYDTPQRIDVGS
jgi:hypothetical protein